MQANPSYRIYANIVKIRKSYLYSGAKEIAFWLGYKEGYAFFKEGREDNGEGSGTKNESRNSYLKGGYEKSKCN